MSFERSSTLHTYIYTPPIALDRVCLSFNRGECSELSQWKGRALGRRKTPPRERCRNSTRPTCSRISETREKRDRENMRPTILISHAHQYKTHEKLGESLNSTSKYHRMARVFLLQLGAEHFGCMTITHVLQTQSEIRGDW